MVRHVLPSPQLDTCREAGPRAPLHSGKEVPPQPGKSAPTALGIEPSWGPTAPFRVEREAPQSREELPRQLGLD